MMHEHNADRRIGNNKSERFAGAILCTTAALTVAFMSIHPIVHAHEPGSFVEEVMRIAPLNRLVHGVLIAVMGVLTVGVWGFSRRLGFDAIPVRGASVAYAMGTAGHIVAAGTNGFVVPAIVSRYADATGTALDPMYALLSLCHTLGNTAEYMAIIAISAAILLWSAVLLTRPSRGRNIGILGLLVGAIPPVMLLAGHLPLNLHGVGAVLLAQSVWYACIGIQLIRERI